MMLVTFARDMAPHNAGDTRLVSDELAEELDDGETLSSSVPWPPVAAEPKPRAPAKPERPVLKPARPAVAPSPRIAR